MSGYYFLDDWSQDNPYPVAQGGANVPGFNALYTGRAQLFALGNTKTINPTTVNEFRFSYLRNTIDFGKPVGGVGVSLASQGFEVGPGTPELFRSLLPPRGSRVLDLIASRLGPIPTN